MQVGLVEKEEYYQFLNDLFLKNPDDDLLLELEWSASDLRHAIWLINKYALENVIDYDAFGRLLFEKLEDIYHLDETNIAHFASKMYAVWQILPSVISRVEPFHILNYADDPLSWGDVQQTKDLYLQAFQFYKLK